MPKRRRKHTSARTPLEACLAELRWLEVAQEDDTVPEEEWRSRGNRLLEAAARLPKRPGERFHEAWEAFQEREAAREGRVYVPSLPPLPAVEPSSEQSAADVEAYRRVQELLRREGHL